MFRAPIGNSGQALVFTELVLKHLHTYRQTKPGDLEAGGQLFAKISLNQVYVCEVTGPRSGDKRGRYSYRPDRKAEQMEIRERHSRDVHFIGDWHTHPEPVPSPSHTDSASMVDCFRKSKHSLNAFLLVIVGNAEFPQSLNLTLYDHSGMVAALDLWPFPELENEFVSP